MTWLYFLKPWSTLKNCKLHRIEIGEGYRFNEHMTRLLTGEGYARLATAEDIAIWEKKT